MTRTGLDGYLKARGIIEDRCCAAWRSTTASPGRRSMPCRRASTSAVVVDATAAIDLDGSRKRMLAEMRQGGIKLTGI